MSSNLYELQQIVQDVVRPALDRHDFGDVALFFACRRAGKTYADVAQQTGLSTVAISRRVNRVEQYVRKAYERAGEVPETRVVVDPYPDQFVDEEGTVWSRIPIRKRAALGGTYGPVDFAFEREDEPGEDYATVQQMLSWDVQPG